MSENWQNLVGKLFLVLSLTVRDYVPSIAKAKSRQTSLPHATPEIIKNMLVIVCNIIA